MIPEPHIELLINDVWQDITGDVRAEPAIEISRGRRDEASQTDPSSASFRLNNRTGRYSPRNPLSSLYGKIGRNTGVRIREGSYAASLHLPGQLTGYATHPDSPELDITGDIDLRAHIEPVSWRRTPLTEGIDAHALARKYVTTADQRSWAWWITGDGELRFRWSPDGTFAATITATSTDPVPESPAGSAIRITLDVDDGAGNHVVRFYTGPDRSGPWTQLGDAITTAGTTSVFASTSAVEVGRIAADSEGLPGISSMYFQGRIFSFEMRDGIDGPVVTLALWTVEDSQVARWGEAIWGTSAWADPDYDDDWQLGLLARVIDESVRFAGEVSEWPSRWELADTDVWVSIHAAGLLRRLNQGATPLRSSMFRDFTADPALVAYYPMEEPKGSPAFTEVVGGQRISIPVGVKAGDYGNLPASDVLPNWSQNVFWGGPVPAYTPAATQETLTFFRLAGDTALQIQLRTTGTLRLWAVTIFGEDDLMLLQAWDQDGTLVLDSGLISMQVTDKDLLLSLQLTQDGADIDWQVAVHPPDSSIFTFFDGTQIGETFGQVTSMTVALGAGEDAVVGHLAHFNGLFSMFKGPVLSGHRGERAANRMVRIAAEQPDLEYQQIGLGIDTAPLGPQRVRTVLELFQEGADSDLGFLGEPKGFLGLIYRTRHTLYNQAPALVLDYDKGELAEPLAPTDDDQAIRNDITVKRDLGAFYRIQRSAGPLSTQPPPAGVGRYDESVTLSLDSETQLPDQASWRLHLGTVDELRLPSITLYLVGPAGDRLADRMQAISRLVEGDKIRITNLPLWLPPGPLDLIVQGWKERIAVNWREIRLNCTPASPWDIWVLEDDDFGRADTSGSKLDVAIDDSQTSFDVAITAGPLWTTDGADFPFDVRVDGEIMRVSAIAGASSPQTFTVARSVNGIVKPHGAGEAVALATPAVLGL